MKVIKTEKSNSSVCALQKNWAAIDLKPTVSWITHAQHGGKIAIIQENISR